MEPTPTTEEKPNEIPPASENPPEEPKSKPPDETLQVLKDIKDRLATPQSDEKPLNKQEIRERIKEKTGMTDAQLDFHEASINTVVTNAVAPLQEKVSWSELKDEVGSIDSSVQDEMKKELAQYPAHLRGDKVLLEKVYYMTMGRMNYRKGSAPQEPRQPEDTVIDRKIVTQHMGPARGLSSPGPSSKVKLSDEEKKMAARFGMTDEDWAKHKDNNSIESFRKK